MVGTPGRLNSLIRSKQLVLNSVAVFVLDEADRLLAGEMCPQTAEVYEALPRRKQVRLCSVYSCIVSVPVAGFL